MNGVRETEVKRYMGERIRFTLRAILLSFALLYSLPILAQENKDVITMKNGDRFTCEIKGLSAGVLSVKLAYVDGTIAVQWSEIANLQSDRLFLIQTESGTVYTGKLSTSEGSKDRPINITIATVPERQLEIPQRQVVSLIRTSEGFWNRFDGAVNTGVLYSKGNESVQYSLGSQVAYHRERWASQGSFNSTFASSSGSEVSTRNQADLNTLRLLRWNNWFYAGSASFLQSSVQEIRHQTTLGAGVGRYLKNNDRAEIYLLGGLAWQNSGYEENRADQNGQNNAVGFVSTEIKVFKFKKTNLDVSATVLPAISNPGRVQFNTNASYYLKVIGDLSWSFTFYGSWDSRPPEMLPKSDYGTSSGLSWTFGRP